MIASDGAGQFRVGAPTRCAGRGPGGWLLARPHRRKPELPRVLERPEIPLHANGSENDIRACVAKRTISGAAMGTAGRTARDAMLGLMKTCSKPGASFFRRLGDRLHVPGATPTLPLPDLVRQAATTA